MGLDHVFGNFFALTALGAISVLVIIVFVGIGIRPKAAVARRRSR